MVLLRTLSIAFCFSLLTSCSCMDQYNPRPFWQKLAQERQLAHEVQPQLTAEGRLPPSLDAGGETAQAQAFSAEQVFQQNCVACHGADGGGNEAMHARNFTDATWQSLATDEEIAAVVLYGALNAPKHVPSLEGRSQFKLQYPTMVGWEHLFSADPEERKEQLAAMVKYIRQFKK